MHDNRQPLSKRLPLITPANGKYWIFTFAYSILSSQWWYESIWIGGPAYQPVLSSQLIHLLIQPLLTPSPPCSKKSLYGASSYREALLTLPVTPNRVQCILVQDHFYNGNMLLCAFESTHFTWHFSCNTSLCKYQYKALETLTWLKSLVLLFLLFYFFLLVTTRFFSFIPVWREFTQ